MPAWTFTHLPRIQCLTKKERPIKLGPLREPSVHRGQNLEEVEQVLDHRVELTELELMPLEPLGNELADALARHTKDVTDLHQGHGRLIERETETHFHDRVVSFDDRLVRVRRDHNFEDLCPQLRELLLGRHDHLGRRSLTLELPLITLGIERMDRFRRSHLRIRTHQRKCARVQGDDARTLREGT